MAPPLRVACLGDSWITDYERGDNADYWKRESHLPEAFFEQLMVESKQEVELVIAGFPGFTADKLLELASLCRLRDMAKVSDIDCYHLPVQGNLKTLLWEQSIPCAWADESSFTPTEDIDVVLIIAGYNDLKYGSGDANRVAETLLQLRQLYASRGIEAILVSIGEGSRGIEWQRRRANWQLLANSSAGVVDCDELVQRLGREMWFNTEHFTPTGYRALGGMLGSVVAQRLREGIKTEGSDPAQHHCSDTSCSNQLYKRRCSRTSETRPAKRWARRHSKQY